MKNFLTFSQVTFMMLIVFGFGAVKAQNYGVKIDYAEFYGDKTQLRFDDLLLGEHVNGQIYNPETDGRARSFTLSAWFKSDADNPYKLTGQILGYGVADYYGHPGSMSADFYSGTLQLSAKVWESGNSYWDRTVVKSPFTYEQNKWYFITLVSDDPAKEIRLYVDGELQATMDTGIDNSGKEMNGMALLSDKSVFYFDNGANGNLPAYYDELQLWNKVLTAEEIKASMNGYSEAPEGLVGYYTLDNPSEINTYPNEGYGAIDCPATIVSSYIYGYVDYNGGYGKQIAANDCKTEGCDKINKIHSYAVTIETTGQGTVVLADGEGQEFPSGTQFNEGTELTVKAVPGENYQVDSIWINETGSDIGDPKFTVAGETVINVFFGLMNTRIAADDGEMTEGGKYSCTDPETTNEYERTSDENGSHYSVPYGKKVKIKVETNDGFVLSGILLKNDAGEELTLPMDDPVFTVSSSAYTIDLNFKRLHTITYSTTEGGKLEMRITENEQERMIGSGEKVVDGTVLTVTPVADENYEIKTVTVNGSTVELTDGNYVTTVDQDLEIKVRYEIRKVFYTVTYTVSGNGTLQVLKAGTTEVNNGERVMEGTQLVIIPEAGNASELRDLKINDIPVTLTGGKYTTEIKNDIRIEALFGGSGIDEVFQGKNIRYNRSDKTLIIDGNFDRAILYKTSGEYLLTSYSNIINTASLSAGNYLLCVDEGSRRFAFKFVIQ